MDETTVDTPPETRRQRIERRLRQFHADMAAGIYPETIPKKEREAALEDILGYKAEQGPFFKEERGAPSPTGLLQEGVQKAINRKAIRDIRTDYQKTVDQTLKARAAEARQQEEDAALAATKSFREQLKEASEAILERFAPRTLGHPSAPTPTPNPPPPTPVLRPDAILAPPPRPAVGAQPLAAPAPTLRPTSSLPATDPARVFGQLLTPQDRYAIASDLDQFRKRRIDEPALRQKLTERISPYIQTDLPSLLQKTLDGLIAGTITFQVPRRGQEPSAPVPLTPPSSPPGPTSGPPAPPPSSPSTIAPPGPSLGESGTPRPLNPKGAGGSTLFARGEEGRGVEPTPPGTEWPPVSRAEPTGRIGGLGPTILKAAPEQPWYGMDPERFGPILKKAFATGTREGLFTLGEIIDATLGGKGSIHQATQDRLAFTAQSPTGVTRRTPPINPLAQRLYEMAARRDHTGPEAESIPEKIAAGLTQFTAEYGPQISAIGGLLTAAGVSAPVTAIGAPALAMAVKGLEHSPMEAAKEAVLGAVPGLVGAISRPFGKVAHTGAQTATGAGFGALQGDDWRDVVATAALFGLPTAALEAGIRSRAPAAKTNAEAVNQAFADLGLDPTTATHADVRSAFRSAAKTTHPDRGGTPESFMDLVSAYNTALGAAKPGPPTASKPMPKPEVRPIERGLPLPRSVTATAEPPQTRPTPKLGAKVETRAAEAVQSLPARLAMPEAQQRLIKQRPEAPAPPIPTMPEAIPPTPPVTRPEAVARPETVTRPEAVERPAPIERPEPMPTPQPVERPTSTERQSSPSVLSKVPSPGESLTPASLKNLAERNPRAEVMVKSSRLRERHLMTAEEAHRLAGRTPEIAEIWVPPKPVTGKTVYGLVNKYGPGDGYFLSPLEEQKLIDYLRPAITDHPLTGMRTKSYGGGYDDVVAVFDPSKLPGGTRRGTEYLVRAHGRYRIHATPKNEKDILGPSPDIQQIKQLVAASTQAVTPEAEKGAPSPPSDLYGGKTVQPRRDLPPAENAELYARALKAEADLGTSEEGRERPSLIEFLRKKGGVQDRGGELSQMEIDRENRPFTKNLIQANGLPLDTAAELAHEAGYLRERNINALLEALDQEARGLTPRTGASWYQEATTGPAKLSRQRVDRAVKKILEDQGRDVGKDVQRIKELLLQDREFLRSPFAPKTDEDWQGLIQEATGHGAETATQMPEPEGGPERTREGERGSFSLRPVPRPRLTGATSPDGRFHSSNPEVEARIRAAQPGLPSTTLNDRLREVTQSIWRRSTREFEFLPDTGEFSPLRTALLQLQKQRGISAERQVRFLQEITGGLDPAQYDLLERKAVLTDLSHEADLGNPLPYGYTKPVLEADLAEVNRLMRLNPKVAERWQARADHWDRTKQAYIAAMTDIGFDVTGRLTKEDYFRHQVLEHARERTAAAVTGTGGGLRTPTGRGFLKPREGSALDISHNLVQAEFEVLAQMDYDTQLAKTIKVVDDTYNIQPTLVEAARTANEQTFQQLLQSEPVLGPTPIQDGWKEIRQNLGMHMARLKADLGLPKDGRLTMEEINRIADDPEAIGHASARGIFKWIVARRKFIKATLGDQFKTWDQLVPEGYDLWQPREGNVFYLVDTIPHQLAQQLQERMLGQLGVTPDQIRQVLAMGQKREQFVVKTEVKATLDALKREPSPVVARTWAQLQGMWKAGKLIGPHAVLKYNLRNLTGDLDPTFVGNPKALLKAPQAFTDLLPLFFGTGPLKGSAKDWFERGGAGTTLQVQEMGDLNELDVFRSMLERSEKRGLQHVPAKVFANYWKGMRLATDYREAILRYANYLSYLDQMGRSKDGRPANYGASIPETVDALTDPKDKAFKLSNELIGAYDRISLTGQHLRRYWIPFWSWKEVNFTRYKQLLKNAFRDGSAGTVGRAALTSTARLGYQTARFAILATGMWSMLQLWNLLIFPDEEDDLSVRTRNRPHIIFGRDDKGKILYLDGIGAIGDLLAWVGLDAFPAHIGDIMHDRMTVGEVVQEMAQQPLNVLIAGLTPAIKLPGELLFGKSTFPDPLRPSPIRDRAEYTVKALTPFGPEYSAAVGKPGPPYLGPESMLNTAVSRQDPGYNAYSEWQDIEDRWRGRLGKPSFHSFQRGPKGEALAQWARAIQYQDRAAALKYRQAYIDEGGTSDGMVQHFRALAPLAGLTKDERGYLMAHLTRHDKQVLKKAEDFFLTDMIKVLSPAQQAKLRASLSRNRGISTTVVPRYDLPAKRPAVGLPLPEEPAETAGGE